MHIRNDESATALAWIVDGALLRQSGEEGGKDELFRWPQFSAYL